MEISEILDMCETCKFNIEITSRIVLYFHGKDSAKNIKSFAGHMLLCKNHFENFKMSDEDALTCENLGLILRKLK